MKDQCARQRAPNLLFMDDNFSDFSGRGSPPRLPGITDVGRVRE